MAVTRKDLQQSNVEITFSKREVVNDPDTGRDTNVETVVFVADGALANVTPYVTIAGVQVADRGFTHTFKTWARRDLDYSLIGTRTLFDPIDDDKTLTQSFQINEVIFDEGQNAFMTVQLSELREAQS
ncbi:hypothetical protein [Gluconobacter sp. DsW_056]|uniref:hypothetical protein n=1 Tax=Gluconobacter sp. DsW_056 TaxID=1511209 RepID=UPI00117B5FD6|nr:hypothetical protein [Gluconobacter sp. DsW_056]